MDVRSFGDKLIETGDLDPVYYVRNADLPEPQLCRLLLAYWCFYHLGAAAWLSEAEGQSFWQLMHWAAENKVAPKLIQDKLTFDRWPRASERRHFRGPKCVSAVEWLRQHSNGSPESLVRDLALPTETRIMNRVQTWPMFGPWIAFKAADMMERVYGAPVTFDRNIGLMYESPKHGLDRLSYETYGINPQPHVQKRQRNLLYSQLLAHFSQFRAPPALDRACGPQEVETILCKWDSHMKGGYTVGKDITEVRHALTGWGETADRIAAVMPEEVT